MVEVKIETLPPRMLALREASKYLGGYSTDRVKELIRTGQLPSVSYGPGHNAKRYIPLAALDAFIDAQLARDRNVKDGHAMADQVKRVLKTVVNNKKAGRL